MTLKLENPNNIEGSLLKLSKLFTVSDSGGISWPAMEKDQWTFILFNQLKFDPLITDELKDTAIWKAINDCARKRDFSVKSFKRFVLAAATKLTSTAPKRYSIIAEINYLNHRPLPRAMATPFGRVVIEKRLRRLDNRLLFSRPQHELKKYEFTQTNAVMRVDITATSEQQALHAGRKGMEGCLGLFHLIHGGYGVTSLSSGPKVPIGKLLITSGTVLVDRDKKEFGNWFMYSEFPQRSAFYHQTNSIDLSKAPKYMRKWGAAIKSCDFSDRVKDAIVLFQQGLSALHAELALIKFWTCIELICAPENSRTAAERIVDRASAIFSDPKASRLRINAIKEMRDRVAHHGTFDSHTGVCAQWASSYAAALIEFSLHNGAFLSKHLDIVEYLSTGNSLEQLERKIRVLKLRKRQMKRKALAS